MGRRQDLVRNVQVVGNASTILEGTFGDEPVVQRDRERTKPECRQALEGIGGVFTAAQQVEAVVVAA